LDFIKFAISSLTFNRKSNNILHVRYYYLNTYQLSTTSIVKISSKGQITLPAPMRKNIETNTLIIFQEGNVFKMKPIKLDSLCKDNSSESEYWLEVAQDSVKFWDNEEDSLWDKV